MKIRQEYNANGIEGYYENNINTYYNPHAKCVEDCLSKIIVSGTVIDFGCGDGLVTKTLMKDKSLSFIGIDKFMAERYNLETGHKAYSLDFKEVAKGLSITADTIICSYVIDLIPHSLLNPIVWSLSQSSNRIITIRPNSHRLYCNWLEEINHVKCGKSRLTEYVVKLN